MHDVFRNALPSPPPLPLSPIYAYIFDKIAGLRNLLNFDVTKAKSAF